MCRMHNLATQLDETHDLKNSVPRLVSRAIPTHCIELARHRILIAA
jgi:hypothetical protein